MTSTFDGMMSSVEWLKEWQTLIGSILGGVIALLAAMIVANAQTRRERRAAAMIILGDLLSVQAAASNLRALATQQNVPEHDYPLWLSEKLTWRRPRLSSVFEAESVRLMDVHTSLAAHLTLFKTVYTTIDESLPRIEEDKDSLLDRGARRAPRNPDATRTDAQAVAHALAVAGRHAECARHYLQALVLSRTPTFTRARMLVWSTAEERQSRALLQNAV